jgi:hypothetical protein
MQSPWLILLTFVMTFAVSACKDAGDSAANALPPGNSPTSYSYKGYNAKGTLVIVGTVSLTSIDGSTLSGSWSLECLVPSEQVGPQTGTGTLIGTLQASKAALNLNPGWADNNVLLSGTIDKGSFKGIWMWSTFAGVTSQGTFEASQSQ